MKHNFIFKPNTWVGKGDISLNMVEEKLIFTTKWKVAKKDSLGKIKAIQKIQIDGISEEMQNELTFFDFTKTGFSVEMENVNIGRILGTGIYDDKMVAWEFKDSSLNFEGFETYFIKKDGSYKVTSEYVTSDQFRTFIAGNISKQ